MSGGKELCWAIYIKWNSQHINKKGYRNYSCNKKIDGAIYSEQKYSVKESNKADETGEAVKSPNRETKRLNYYNQ